MLLNIGIFAFCLVVAAFFAATEVAFFSLTPLSVTRGDRVKLEKLFLSFGFSKLRQHQRKDITFFRQNEIQFLQFEQSTLPSYRPKA